jgi:hypothetical protein
MLAPVLLNPPPLPLPARGRGRTSRGVERGARIPTAVILGFIPRTHGAAGWVRVAGAVGSTGVRACCAMDPRDEPEDDIGGQGLRSDARGVRRSDPPPLDGEGLGVG